MSFVYRFVNEQEEIIYVGRTNNIHIRLGHQHFKKHGHLSDTCYNECKYVDYAELASDNDSKIYEIYLIDKYSPKNNVTLTKSGAVSLTLPELSWVRTERDAPARDVVVSDMDEFNEKIDCVLNRIELTAKTLEFLEIEKLISRELTERKQHSTLAAINSISESIMTDVSTIKELQKFYLMNQETINRN